MGVVMEIMTSGLCEADRRLVHFAQFPWEEQGVVGIQGSSSCVFFDQGHRPYEAAFVEVWGGAPKFLHSQGVSILEAERNAWSAFSRILECAIHRFCAGDRRDGSGVCLNCGMVEHGVFSASDLGLRCRICRAPTFDRDRTGIVCEEHHPGQEFRVRARLLRAAGSEVDEQGNSWSSLWRKYLNAGRGEFAQQSRLR